MVNRRAGLSTCAADVLCPKNMKSLQELDRPGETIRSCSGLTVRNQRSGRARRLFGCLAVAAALVLPGPGARAVDIAPVRLAIETPAAQAVDMPLVAFDARIAGDDARTRIIIDFDRKPDIRIHYVANPFRILIDLPETHFGLKPENMEARGVFSDIRYGAMAEGRSRIVLTAKRPVGMAVSDVRQDDGGASYRLVLDAAIVTEQAFAALVAEQSWKDTSPIVEGAPPVLLPGARAGNAEFVIAVDAGHGGIDNGAVGGTTKTEEKHVTLAFAHKLVDKLNTIAGIRAFLTRDKDEFLSLPQRVQLARHGKANLFISVHADTLRQKDVRGATVYTISDKASDSLAAELAERENLSDEIAGLSFSDEPAEVADILIDLTRRETQAFSISLARSVLAAFEGEVRLINNPHRYAGFRVLQAPDVPSVLLELGFLSNREDEKLLLDPTWQAKVAGLIAQAIQRYRTDIVANGG